jgi:hypothetical protein
LTTDYSSSGLSFGRTGRVCEVSASRSNQSFNYVNDYDSVESITDPHAKYDRMSWTVLPTLAVFMPVADARRITSMDFTTSVVSCLGIKHFNRGSRVPAAAPEVPPTNSHVQRLNGGAIAGIAIGSVVGLSLAWVMLSLYRLRRSKANWVGIDPNGDEALQMDLLGLVEAGSEGAVQEIDSEEAHISELPDTMSENLVELVGCASHT